MCNNTIDDGYSNGVDDIICKTEDLEFSNLLKEIDQALADTMLLHAPEFVNEKSLREASKRNNIGVLVRYANLRKKLSIYINK